MNLYFSIIVPVYNRPDEIGALLETLAHQSYVDEFEVVVVDDGSTRTSREIVERYKNRLQVSYYFKPNSGPGLSRNFGMEKAKGNYFIILDSDVLLPENYLQTVAIQLQKKYTDAYGGPDASRPDFTVIQRAINYAMTSFLTTGGLRGSESERKKFQIRSFNMGLSEKAFTLTGGFSAQRFGEDIDLSHRLWAHGLKTQFIAAAYVYHKRRTTYRQFFKQTFNFGAARPVLNKMHPGSSKLTYWFPALFTMGLVLSVGFFVYGKLNHQSLFTYPIYFYVAYFTAIFFNALYKERYNVNEEACSVSGDSPCGVLLKTGFHSLIATLVQFTGYGLGFLRSFFRLNILRRNVKETFPEMFR